MGATLNAGIEAHVEASIIFDCSPTFQSAEYVGATDGLLIVSVALCGLNGEDCIDFPRPPNRGGKCYVPTGFRGPNFTRLVISPAFTLR